MDPAGQANVMSTPAQDDSSTARTRGRFLVTAILTFLATRVVAPRLPNAERLVPGTPKRFAQGIGTALSTAAAVAWLGFGASGVGVALVAAIALFVAATSAACPPYTWHEVVSQVS